MKFREAMTQVKGLRYIYESLELLSSPGKRCLLDREMMVEGDIIKDSFREISATISWIEDTTNSGALMRVARCLMQLNDILPTLNRLKNGGVGDDVELFEIKQLAMLAIAIKDCVDESNFPLLTLPDLSEVVELLDPEKTNTPHFFIYNAYDSRLKQLRNKLNDVDAGSEEAANIYTSITVIENEVREKIASRLYPYLAMLILVIDLLANLDIRLAICKYAIGNKFALPIIKEQGEIKYSGLYNPEVADALARESIKYQPIDVAVSQGVSLITGANMGGKSVLLKTIALAQTMAQFGLPVPALNATIIPMEEVIICIGDGQSELSGLSSFAAEMLSIDSALKRVKNRKSLVLIDEPARTTNPSEGQAIANAIIDLFNRTLAYTVITSHYSGLHSNHRFRVKGLSGANLPEKMIYNDLQHYMDYSLIEETGDEDVPQEALSVAEMLGIDKTLIERAHHYLDN